MTVYGSAIIQSDRLLVWSQNETELILLFADKVKNYMEIKRLLIPQDCSLSLIYALIK